MLWSNVSPPLSKILKSTIYTHVTLSSFPSTKAKRHASERSDISIQLQVQKSTYYITTPHLRLQSFELKVFLAPLRLPSHSQEALCIFGFVLYSLKWSAGYHTFTLLFHSGRPLMTPSNAASATAFAGKALRKHGKNPLQKPLGPSLRHISIAASFHLGKRLSPSLRAPPSGSVMSRCFTTSDG